MAYNRPDPQVHRWFIPGKEFRYAVNSMPTWFFSLLAIFFMQLWGGFGLGRHSGEEGCVTASRDDVNLGFDIDPTPVTPAQTGVQIHVTPAQAGVYG